MSNSRSRSDIVLRVIALFKMVKALIFFCAGIGVLHFLHHDVEVSLMHVINQSHVDSDNQVARWCLDEAGRLTSVKIKLISAVCFFYGLLFAIEGVGLFLRKRWAEYFVVIVTASLLPYEIYEVLHKFHWMKLVLVAINLIVLGYLILVIRWRLQKAGDE